LMKKAILVIVFLALITSLGLLYFYQHAFILKMDTVEEHTPLDSPKVSANNIRSEEVQSLKKQSTTKKIKKTSKPPFQKPSMPSKRVRKTRSKVISEKTEKKPMDDGQKKEDPSNLNEQTQALHLIVAINTIGRPKQEPYLKRTANILYNELKTYNSLPLSKKQAMCKFSVTNSYVDRVSTVFVNMVDNHPVFDQTKAYFTKDHVDKPFFHFIDKASRILVKPQGGRVPYTAQQQSYDLFRLTQIVSNEFAKDPHTFVLLLEDDMEMCSLEAVIHYLCKANFFYPSALGIRSSFGLNGIILPSDVVPHLGRYFKKHAARRPPDHLTSEFMGLETEESKKIATSLNRLTTHPVSGTRHNLFNHIGKVSTISKGQHTGFWYPPCFHDLVFPVVFNVEAWQKKTCGHTDLGPTCEVDESRSSHDAYLRQLFTPPSTGCTFCSTPIPF